MRILITGAGRGIGAGIARVCAAGGHDLALVARSADEIDALAAELDGDGRRVIACRADVADEAAVTAAAERAVEALGGLDAAVCNAGVSHRTAVDELTLEQWRAMIDTNLTGAFLTTRAVLPHLRRAGRGHLVFVSSISGRLPLAPGSGYAASKWGLSGFAESLHGELRDDDIKVTLVYPGSVATKLHDRAGDTDWMLAPEDVGRSIRHALETPPGVLVHRLEIRPLNRGSK